jgi:hypothetical protein
MAGLEPSTFRLRARCYASNRTAQVGFSLLTLGPASVQTAPDGYRRIDWMIIGMIKAHSILNRVASRAAATCVGAARHHASNCDSEE